MKIEKVLELLEISVQDKDEASIDKWKRYYEGFDKDFHEYTKSIGTGKEKKMKRYSLGMAKIIAENWADVIYNPETSITVEDEANQEWLDETLERVDFTTNMNNLVEMYMALGTGGTNVYKDGNKPMIDFLYTNQIFPISYINNEVAEVLFISQYDKNTIYVTVHELNDNDTYRIRNKFIDIKDENNYEIKEMEGIEEEFNSTVKLFEIFKPAISNNINVGSSEGVSIYANAIQELQAVDISFDSLVTESENGKMMIFLKEAMLQFGTDKNGNQTAPTINNSNGVFYVMEGDSVNDEGTFIKTHSPTLRIESLIEGLKYNMNLLARKCGLGDNYFSSNEGSIYTNTAQVVSTNSKFFKTRQKHLALVKANLVGVVKALYYQEFDKELEDVITINFDDSMIHDKAEEKQGLMLELNQGLISDVYYYMKTMNLTRTEALAFKQQMQEDKGLEEEIDFESE